MKDFFISYNRFDVQWATWIAWILEEANFSVFIQAWDFRPGGNFILDMQRAMSESRMTIAVLSDTYLKSAYTQPEWAAAFVDDPVSLQRKLIPVRVKSCQPEGLLKPLVYVDLLGVSEAEAKRRILDMMQERVKPDTKPAFPGEIEAPAIGYPVRVSLGTQASPLATSRVQAIKLKAYNEQLSALEADYDAAFEQMSTCIDKVVCTRLERRIQSIEAEIDHVAAKLKALQLQ
jgi:hypothetical protein